MQPAGWAMMIISISTILSLTVFCVTKVLWLPASDVDELQGPLQIDTGDTLDAD